MDKYDNDKSDKKYKTTKGKKRNKENVNAEFNEYSLNGE